jgi:hypothetical protein
MFGHQGAVEGFGDHIRLNHPFRNTIDSAGNLYICDEYNSIVRKLIRPPIEDLINSSKEVSCLPCNWIFDLCLSLEDCASSVR